jgi:hypothetical protein
MSRLRRIWDAIRDVKSTEHSTVPKSDIAPIAASRYCVALTDRELRQGEIITGLIHYIVRADPEKPGNVITSGVSLPYAIIATPDCDLLHSFRAIRDSKSERINGVLFFEAEEALVARKRIPLNTQQWRDVRRSRLEGYHLLNCFQPRHDLLGQQIPDLLIDFKRYFMLPTLEVYRQCQLVNQPKATRRCYLGDLWREDLQQRAMSFMQRVGTPDPEDIS